MKFLYISPEHVSGTLSLLQAEHRRRGDQCRYVTFWHSRWHFPDDICLNAPLMPDRAWVRALRLISSIGSASEQDSANSLPRWRPGLLGQALFAVRDTLIWPTVKKTIREHSLFETDIVQLDGGLDFTRDARFVRECRKRGKHVAAFYHGSDMRTRGIVESVDRHVELRLTSEWDLLDMDPRLNYVYLPFETSLYPSRPYAPHSPVRICHAARNRFKGTAQLIKAVDRLRLDHPVELRVMRNLSHAEALRVKSECDIFVDQLTNEAGWGYGMSSVEALAMGMPVVTNIPATMENQIGDHPFIQGNVGSIRDILEYLIRNPDIAAKHASHGKKWVTERHDVKAVGDSLYALYRQLGWM